MGRRTVLITGGGTGGHVYPGLALAEALTHAAPDVDVVWVGTRGRVEETAVPRAGLPIEFIDVGFLKGTKGAARAKALLGLPMAGFSALRLLRRYRPVAVIGVGGFASGPVGAAAAATGTPLFVLEQNSVPGLTNRMLARVADTVYASFEAARVAFASGVVKTLGNPIRASLINDASRRRPGHPLRVLVLGGSQGARVLNECVPRVLAEVVTSGTTLEVLHGAGAGNAEAVAAAYAELELVADVRPYIDDMAAAYSNVDFVISRAGATTIAELTAVGLPAMYVPFAAAADDHQTTNARVVVEAGGAVMVSEEELRDGDRAVRVLTPLLRHAEVLDRMAGAARAIGRPDASSRIARDILEQIA